MDLALRRSSSPGAAFAPWLLAALLSLTVPVPALAQASQAPTGQTPETTAPAPETAAPAPKTAAPNPQSRDGRQFQDWTLQCKPDAGKTEFCEMQQRVVNQKGDRVLLAVVGRVRELNAPGMLILLPLGIALPPGSFLKIDDGERQRLDINQCEKQGCRVEMLLKPELLTQLKAGTKAIVSFYIFDQQGKQAQINVPVSLLGFSAALAEVMK